jgi:hypothetical protein
VSFCAQISASAIEKHLDREGRFKHNPSSFRKPEAQSSISWLEELNSIVPNCVSGSEKYIAPEIGGTLSGKYGFANRVATDTEARVMMESIVLARRSYSEINQYVYAQNFPENLAANPLIKTHFSVLLGIDRATAIYMRQLKGDSSHFDYINSFPQYGKKRETALELLNCLDAHSLRVIDSIVRDIWGKLPKVFKFELDLVRTPVAPPSISPGYGHTAAPSRASVSPHSSSSLSAEHLSAEQKSILDAFSGLRVSDNDMREISRAFGIPYQGNPEPLKPGERFLSEAEFQRSLASLDPKVAANLRSIYNEAKSMVENLLMRGFPLRPSALPTPLTSQTVRPIRVTLGNGVVITRKDGRYTYSGGFFNTESRSLNFNGFILKPEFTEEEFMEAVRGHGNIIETTYL